MIENQKLSSAEEDRELTPDRGSNPVLGGKSRILSDGRMVPGQYELKMREHVYDSIRIRDKDNEVL